MNTFKSLGLQADPIAGFSSWLAEAEAAGIVQSEAFSLATVDLEGAPSIRTVLFKGMYQNGFGFFTNYNSAKAVDLNNNVNAALLFFWQAQARQVRINGTVQKLSQSESQAYFASRDRGSQIGAWASAQSEDLSSREELIEQVKVLEARYANEQVPCPPHWGGYRVEPVTMEFWQGREDRLHDRFEFTRLGTEWAYRRLAP
jgi:pyridoxamine 5'-phosphate oxidase